MFNNVDIEKLVAVADRYLSPAWARFLGQVLVVSVVVAAFSLSATLFFDSLIGGVAWPFFVKLFGGRETGISLDNIEAIILVLVSAVAFFVLMFAVFVVAVIKVFRRRIVSQAAIDELAELRDAGIAVLNDIPKNPGALTEDDKEAFVVEWKARWIAWAKRVVDALAKNFTKAEMLSFAHIGLIKRTDLKSPYSEARSLFDAVSEAIDGPRKPDPAPSGASLDSPHDSVDV